MDCKLDSRLSSLLSGPKCPGANGKKCQMLNWTEAIWLAVSVKRFGDFWKFLTTIFVLKVAQIFGDIFSSYELQNF